MKFIVALIVLSMTVAMVAAERKMHREVIRPSKVHRSRRHSHQARPLMKSTKVKTPKAQSTTAVSAPTTPASKAAVVAKVNPVAPVAQAKVAVDTAASAAAAVAVAVAVTTDSVNEVLPEVSAIMGGSDQTMKDINSKASVLQAQLTKLQMENEAKLSRQKSVFEQKLKQQGIDSRSVTKQNKKISKHIALLEKENAAITGHCKELQDGNKVIRTELKLLESRQGSVKTFLAASLKSTDDTGAKELDVLDPAKQKVASVAHALSEGHVTTQKGKDDAKDDDKDDDDDDDDDDKDDSAPSFLSTNMKLQTGADMTAETSELDSLFDGSAQTQQNSPNDLVDILSSGVKRLQQEEKENEAKLKTMFLSSFKAGVKQRDTLRSTQKALNGTQASLETSQVQLHTAENRLVSTRKNLEQRLQATGHFMEQLVKLALAPLGPETARNMRGIPAAVTLPILTTGDVQTDDGSAAIDAPVADLS